MSFGQQNMEEIENLKHKVSRLSKENNRLRRSVNELTTLNELALAISGRIDSEEIMNTIISRSIRSIGAQQGDITLIDEEQEEPGKTLVRSMVNSSHHSPLHLNQNLHGWMQINKKTLKIDDPENDTRFKNVEWEESIKSVLSAPLMIRSKLIGILTLYNKENEEVFTEQDKRLLSIIASQSAQVVENARLHEKEQALKEMRREVELAAKIQKQLLPKETPKLDNYELCGKNKTARTVGGDYYDFIQLDANRWAICLGDVSGKGMPASLLMSNLQAILRGQTFHQYSPGKLLEKANRQLYQSMGIEKFITLFLGILDTEAHTLEYSNGGHEFPFLIRKDNKCNRLEAGGIPVGVMENREYETEKISLDRGDKLIVFSDGIIDSQNADDEIFGEDRLKKKLLTNTKNSGSELIESAFKASLEHNEQQEPFDDMTMVVLTRHS